MQMNEQSLISDVVTADRGPWLTGQVDWPLFNCKVAVTFGRNGTVSLQYAERCILQLLHLKEAEVDSLLRASIAFFRDEEYCHGEPVEMMLEFEGMPYPERLEQPERILPYIKPVEISIDREVPGVESVSVFSECAWEPEHGLQWVVRNGKALFVGAFSGVESHGEDQLYQEIWKEENYLISGRGKSSE